MGRRGHRATGGKTAGYGGLMLVLLLVACAAGRDSPERRAQDFIEALTAAPPEAQRLRDIADLPPERHPEDLIDGLAARVALDFLRAKRAQGVALTFARGDVRQTNAAQRVVTIRVSPTLTTTPGDGAVRFQVQVEKDDQGRWRITRVTGGN